jgi:hypothetical protein
MYPDFLAFKVGPASLLSLMQMAVGDGGSTGNGSRQICGRLLRQNGIGSGASSIQARCMLLRLARETGK